MESSAVLRMDYQKERVYSDDRKGGDSRALL